MIPLLVISIIPVTVGMCILSYWRGVSHGYRLREDDRVRSIKLVYKAWIDGMLAERMRVDSAEAQDPEFRAVGEFKIEESSN